MVSHPTEAGGASAEALALAPHCHDELLQGDAMYTLRQVRIPGKQSNS